MAQTTVTPTLNVPTPSDPGHVHAMTVTKVMAIHVLISMNVEQILPHVIQMQHVLILLVPSNAYVLTVSTEMVQLVQVVIFASLFIERTITP